MVKDQQQLHRAPAEVERRIPMSVDRLDVWGLHSGWEVRGER